MQQVYAEIKPWHFNIGAGFLKIKNMNYVLLAANR
jgi:hypothetical protein